MWESSKGLRHEIKGQREILIIESGGKENEAVRKLRLVEGTIPNQM